MWGEIIPDRGNRKCKSPESPQHFYGIIQNEVNEDLSGKAQNGTPAQGRIIQDYVDYMKTGFYSEMQVLYSFQERQYMPQLSLRNH